MKDTHTPSLQQGTAINTLLLVVAVASLLFGGGLLVYNQHKPKQDAALAAVVEESEPESFEKKLSFSQANPNQGMFVKTVRLYNDKLPDEIVVERVVHHPAFKTKQFIDQHAKRWTIELLRTYDERVITDVLDQTQQNKHFQYFRITQNKQDVYVLTVGDFGSRSDAESVKPVFAGFIPTVRSTVNTFAAYQKEVSDRSGDEVFSANTRVRDVKLARVYERPYQPPIVVVSAVDTPKRTEKNEVSNTEQSSNMSPHSENKLSESSETVSLPNDKATDSIEHVESNPEVAVKP